MKNTRFTVTLLAFCLTSLAVGAQEASMLDHGRFALGGYGDVGYEDSDFRNAAYRAKFVPIFLFQLNDKIHVESEIEFSFSEDGETETELEYADIHYFLTDRATITAGKFLLPFGQFGPNLHPSWINRLPTAPGAYGGHGGNGIMSGVIPVLSDQGIGLQYSFDLAKRAKVFVDVYGVNGVSAEAHEDGGDEPETDHGITFPEIEFESSSGDNNSSKAIGGRIALAFLPRLEVGASFYRSDYDDAEELEFNASAIDVSWLGQYWSLRGEYIRTEADAFIEQGEAHSEEEDVAGDEAGDNLIRTRFNRSASYVQVAWQLRQLSMQQLNPFELVIRHSRTGEVSEGKRWTLGVNYWMSPSAALKLAYEDTKMKDGRDDTRLFLQLSYGF